MVNVLFFFKYVCSNRSRSLRTDIESYTSLDLTARPHTIIYEVNI